MDSSTRPLPFPFPACRLLPALWGMTRSPVPKLCYTLLSPLHPYPGRYLVCVLRERQRKEACGDSQLSPRVDLGCSGFLPGMSPLPLVSWTWGHMNRLCPRLRTAVYAVRDSGSPSARSLLASLGLHLCVATGLLPDQDSNPGHCTYPISHPADLGAGKLCAGVGGGGLSGAG